MSKHQYGDLLLLTVDAGLDRVRDQMEKQIECWEVWRRGDLRTAELYAFMGHDEDGNPILHRLR